MQLSSLLLGYFYLYILYLKFISYLYICAGAQTLMLVGAAIPLLHYRLGVSVFCVDLPGLNIGCNWKHMQYLACHACHLPCLT